MLTSDELGTWQFGTESGGTRWQVLGAILEAMKILSPARRADLTARIMAQSGDKAGAASWPDERDAGAGAGKLPRSHHWSA